MGMNVQDFEQKTYKYFVQVNGWPEAAVRAYINRAYEGAKLSDVCSPEHVQELSKRYGNKPAQKPVQKSNVTIGEVVDYLSQEVKREVTPDVAKVETEVPTERKKKPTFTWRRQYLLDVINIGEMSMVAIGSVLMFGVYGLVPGIMCIAFYAHSALEMRKGEKEFAQDLGLFVCGVLALVFTWLHGQTFWKLFDGAHNIREPVSIACSWIVSIISFFALWQTRNVRT